METTKVGCSNATAAILFGGLLSFLGAIGCGTTRDTSGDASADSIPDTGPKPDAGHDAGHDAAHDAAREAATDAPPPVGKIEHIIMIVQENRSFDHYFGMFPGTDGFTLDDAGNPTNSNPNPIQDGGLQKAFHDPEDSNTGAKHDNGAFVTCYDDGKMDGFIASAVDTDTVCDAGSDNPICSNGIALDVMGYKTGADIPNYWAYAKAFTLEDHLFESVSSWSWPMHQFMVSEWAADCTDGDAMSCTSNISDQAPVSAGTFSWTPLTYLLDNAKVSWKYYLASGTVPDCDDGAMDCPPATLLPSVGSLWNPLPFFEVVSPAEQTTNIVDINEFYMDVQAGTVPAVSWIVPSNPVSEHPPNLVSEGQAYVTALINTVMQDELLWSTTVIILFWDDWGGFYDHVPPVAVDANGFGFRTPGILISPWSKPGYIDHQQASYDAYTRFIEDTFLAGQRLDPTTDGRPDPRPDVRETLPQSGNIQSDFDLTQKPNPPLILKPM
jgi:phospholipase C